MKDSFVVNKDGSFADLPATPIATKQAPAAAAEKAAAAVVEPTEKTESSTVTPESTDVVVEEAEATAATADEAEIVEPDDEGAPEANAQKGGRARARIEELAGDNKALRELVEILRAKASEGVKAPATEAASQPAATTTATAVDEEPTLESCGFDTAKWTKAMTAWTRKQVQAEVQAGLKGQQQQQTQ